MSRPNIIPLYTYDDYKLWQGDWELIAGHPVAMSPSPIRKHQKVAGDIYYAFKSQINEKTNCDCDVLYEIDWVVSEKNVLRPDIVVTCENSDEDFLVKAPNIIVEILSPSTREKDINTKFNMYEEEKVLYYIVADPDNDSIEVYELVNKEYQLVDNKDDAFQFELNDGCNLFVDLSLVFK